MNPILEIQKVSKRFKINHRAEPYLSLRDRITSIFEFNRSQEEFWALHDVSFSMMEGDSLGIIGSNGAGKSTLLKILSRITPPTLGRIICRGRVASLLEVGTGFHMELTGRENIFMNGSILGMRRAEISHRFDDIVEFAGVEKFIDTPLKHYSSGMQLRLAFSVAAFLEPEILIIDEVLAVGDADFQKKCLGKMENVSRSGRTIIFVSHNLDAVESLCKNSILLSTGRLVEFGPSANVIQKYVSKNEDIAFRSVLLTPTVRLEKLSFSELSIVSGDSLQFLIELMLLDSKEPLITDFCLLFYNYKKQRVAILDLRKYFGDFKKSPGKIEFTGKISRFNLVEGVYSVGLFYGIDSKHADLYDLERIQVRNEVTSNVVIPYDVQYRGFVELS